VPPSIEFVSLVFALFKAGVVTILIDPGMGRKNLLRCLEDARPEGFVAIPLVQAIRSVLRRRYPEARFNVTVGRRWFWNGVTLDELRGGPWSGTELADTKADDPAAVIFTTGSTGPPRGVHYTQDNFDQQVAEIQAQYDIQPGEVDLPGFPLFGLFNAAMGVTTVIPDMNPTRPARVDPRNIIEAVGDWQVTQAFGSPAIWQRVGPYCQQHKIRLPTLRRVLSAGAPVPPAVLASMRAVMADDGTMHTPYGATEALPVATIESREVLEETQFAWAQGRGTCVGRRFPGITWRVIRITDDPLPTFAECQELPCGEIGELIVRGAVVTRAYATRTEANAAAKIADGDDFWHRMGDVGYFDEQERFWFCGRKAHRVETAKGPLFTDPVEGIFNQHPLVLRSALVGIGSRGEQRPVVIIELRHDIKLRGGPAAVIHDLRELGQKQAITRGIEDFLIHPSFPVDIRHNAKIFREKLAVWAARQL
jgi:acyl-CoA synthetase (AMP-forming)/AMP-acid ligase II